METDTYRRFKNDSNAVNQLVDDCYRQAGLPPGAEITYDAFRLWALTEPSVLLFFAELAASVNVLLESLAQASVAQPSTDTPTADPSVSAADVVLQRVSSANNNATTVPLATTAPQKRTRAQSVEILFAHAADRGEHELLEAANNLKFAPVTHGASGQASSKDTSPGKHRANSRRHDRRSHLADEYAVTVEAPPTHRGRRRASGCHASS